METDVVIVGAGPSGLSAAIELAKGGLSVVVIDEYYRTGGRLLGQFYEDPFSPPEQREWNGEQIAKTLTLEAEKLGVHLLINTTVWSVMPGWVTEVVGATVQTIKSKALLLATGSMEKAVPIPGWTLPGVYSIGAAQTLTNLHKISLGSKVLIVGVDPLSLSVMMEMKKAGMDVVGMTLPPLNENLDYSYSPMDALNQLEQVIHLAPNFILRKLGQVTLGKLNKLIAHCLRFNLLRVNGTPLYLRKAIISIEGKNDVESVTLQSISADGKLTGKIHRKEVDAVCLSGGLIPLMDLAQVAGCEIVNVPELGGIIPLHGPDLSTTVDGLYLCGNITGIEGAKVAIAQGKVAAVSILQYLGKRTSQSKEKAMKEVEYARDNSPISFFPDIISGRKKMAMLWSEKLNEGYDYMQM